MRARRRRPVLAAGVPREPVPSPEQAPQAAAALLQPRLRAAAQGRDRGTRVRWSQGSAPPAGNASEPHHTAGRMLVPSTSQHRDKGSPS